MTVGVTLSLPMRDAMWSERDGTAAVTVLRSRRAGTTALIQNSLQKVQLQRAVYRYRRRAGGSAVPFRLEETLGGVL